MRDVIDELRGLALRSEREFTPSARPDYRAFDEMAVELEVAEFLFSLVRATKPSVVVESGAGAGYSTLAIAGALERNMSGRLFSYEPEQRFRFQATRRIGKNWDWVTILPGSSLDCAGGTVDMVFLDSGPATRERELERWLGESVLLIVHDAFRYGVLKREGGFLLRTPRGLWFRDRRK